MTILPLTRRPGGLQAFKQIIPAGAATRAPEPKTHEGYEWLYVLSGRLRLVLGDHDLVLAAGRGGRVRHPHAALVRQPRSRDPAEVLALFGPQGERMHVRARSTGSRSARGQRLREPLDRAGRGPTARRSRRASRDRRAREGRVRSGEPRSMSRATATTVGATSR